MLAVQEALRALLTASVPKDSGSRALDVGSGLGAADHGLCRLGDRIGPERSKRDARITGQRKADQHDQHGRQAQRDAVRALPVHEADREESSDVS